METNAPLLRWLGHAGFKISFKDASNTQRVIYIDAWENCPTFPAALKGTLNDADLVLVTHGHFDHAGSAVDLVSNSTKECKVVASGEVTQYFQGKGVAESKLARMNKGGTVNFGFCKVTAVSADHSSSCMDDTGKHTISGGAPMGFVIDIGDGK